MTVPSRPPLHPTEDRGPRTGPRSFLRDDDLTPAEQARVLDLAATLKADPFAGGAGGGARARAPG
jgi:hypothetical protein